MGKEKLKTYNYKEVFIRSNCYIDKRIYNNGEHLMRKICIILVALVLSMLFLGCAITDDTQQSDHANAELPNPWDEWSSLDDAEKAVGFEFGLPAVITDSYKSDSFRTLNNELIEVVYHDGKYEVTIRQQKGEGQDISGDYNEYFNTSIISRCHRFCPGSYPDYRIQGILRTC